MDKKLIQVGKVYMAQHAGQLVKVRVDDIRVLAGIKIFNRPSLTRYYCTKLKTGRLHKNSRCLIQPQRRDPMAKIVCIFIITQDDRAKIY